MTHQNQTLLPYSFETAHERLRMGRRISSWASFAHNLIIRHGIKQVINLVRLYAIALLARIGGQPLIHVIGDSHVQAFKDISLYVLIHRVGPSTAYNLQRKSSTTNSNKQLFKIIGKSNRRDIFILVFGEIDCRIHIYNQYKKNEGKSTISELIDKTIANYGDVLDQLSQLGINFTVYSVPPAGRAENTFGSPHYASREMRGMITGEFNQKLKLLCRERGYKFLDVYSAVCDRNGFMCDEYAFDDTHLNSKVKRIIIGRFSEEFGIELDRSPWTLGWQGILRKALSR